MNLKIPETRGKNGNRKYPWHLLKRVGSYFVWDNPEDAQRLRTAAYSRKISVAIRTIDGKCRVYRIEEKA